MEFTDDDGHGLGKGLYLQLKAGNSHLRRRADGTEIFQIKKQRWVRTWISQPYPVMLVVGTFTNTEQVPSPGHRIEFSDVRWMEISSVLKRTSENGTKRVNQIVFKGERLDMASVRKWRERILSARS